MEGYLSTKEAAEKWGISIRQVQNHCKNGRIKGVQKIGTNYLIPENATKPKYTYVYETGSKNKDS
ncbi:MAG: helix-turn-helix domain-containing protein [Clostridia bacterium]|nr:helix-turn-helix domain-containing protein [Clostridia bacterium]